MTIFSVLKQEHRNLNKYLDELQSSLTKTTEQPRDLLFQNFKQTLLAHAEAERKSLYDRLCDEPATSQVIKQAQYQYDAVEALLHELEVLSPRQVQWSQKLAQLRGQLDDHVRAEEAVIFPRAKAILEKREQQDIAEEFRDHKLFMLEACV